MVDYSGSSRTLGEGRDSPAMGVFGGSVSLGAEQMGKLKHELDIVQNNITVFGDMLNELSPANEHAADWQLLQVPPFLLHINYIRE